jgi:hypothetical protein
VLVEVVGAVLEESSPVRRWAGDVTEPKERPDRGDRLVGALRLGSARRAASHERAPELGVDVLAHRAARSTSSGTAARGPAPDPGEVGAVVGEERHAGEVPGDLGSVRQKLFVSSSPSSGGRVADDDRRHRARPAEEVAVERLEQSLDVLPA